MHCNGTFGGIYSTEQTNEIDQIPADAMKITKDMLTIGTHTNAETSKPLKYK